MSAPSEPQTPQRKVPFSEPQTPQRERLFPDPTTPDRPFTLPPSGSPVKRNTAGASLYAADAPKALDKQSGLAKEMADQFHRMTVDDFMEKYVPEGAQCPPQFEGAFDAMPPKGSPKYKEVIMYKPFVESVTQEICPGYRFIATPFHKDTTDPTREKVDLALYSNDVADEIEKVPSKKVRTRKRPLEADEWTPDTEANKKGKSTKRKRTTEQNKSPRRPRWAHMKLYAEFKVEGTVDPFNDDQRQPFERQTQEAARRRGQIISYAEILNARQQRTHAFSIYIMGALARIIRWDRSCAVVTEKFDYRKNPEILGKFLYRFAKLSPEQQGEDPTAVALCKGDMEYQLMDVLGQTPPNGTKDYVKEYFHQSLIGDWPRWKLSVRRNHVADSGQTTSSGQKKKEDEGENDHFLVGRPHFCAQGMVGRGTRGYIAYHIQDRTFVFLKDAWRIDMPKMEQEGKVLEELNKAKVRFIPTLVCHGDIRNQRTATRALWKKDDTVVKTHTHYRLVVKEIGKSLCEFGTGMELVNVIYEAMFAHKLAYDQKILHRDVSAGNILFVPSDDVGQPGTALLTDWEMCKRVVETPEAETPRQPNRTGTWQFMSARILKHPERPHTLQDDLESFLHVLVYHVIRWLPHNCEAVGSFMREYFDSYVHRKKKDIGGQVKEGSFNRGTIEVASNVEESHKLLVHVPPIDQLIDLLVKDFKDYYALLRRRDEEAEKALGMSHPAPTLADNTLNAPNRITARKLVLPPVLAGAVPITTEALSIQELEARSAKLQDHTYMLVTWFGILENGVWTADDRVKDQLPPNYLGAFGHYQSRQTDTKQTGTKRSHKEVDTKDDKEVQVEVEGEEDEIDDDEEDDDDDDDKVTESTDSPLSFLSCSEKDMAEDEDEDVYDGLTDQRPAKRSRSSFDSE